MTLVIGLEKKNRWYFDDGFVPWKWFRKPRKQAIGKLVKPSFVYYLDIRIAAIHARYINVLGTM